MPYRLIRWVFFAGALVFLLSGPLACREQRTGDTPSKRSGTKSIENKGSDTLVNPALVLSMNLAATVIRSYFRRRRQW